MKTNTGIFVVFKAKRELKCQFSGITKELLRFFDELFDVINDNPFLTFVSFKKNIIGCFTK